MLYGLLFPPAPIPPATIRHVGSAVDEGKDQIRPDVVRGRLRQSPGLHDTAYVAGFASSSHSDDDRPVHDIALSISVAADHSTETTRNVCEVS